MTIGSIFLLLCAFSYSHPASAQGMAEYGGALSISGELARKLDRKMSSVVDNGAAAIDRKQPVTPQNLSFPGDAPGTAESQSVPSP